jgi:hypothetical protein
LGAQAGGGAAMSEPFVTLEELEQICKAEPTSYVVEGMLPADDVHVAVGDSGLGKTPWAYQLGLCVASGTSFLGHATRQGKVLYYDLENGREEILEVGKAVSRCVGITPLPPSFFVLRDEGNATPLEEAIRSYGPILAIVDTLRALSPRAEASNDEMAAFLKRPKIIARHYHCAILLIHHIKKPENGVASSLDITPVLEWLLQASGARALINQTNARIAFDVPRAFDMKEHSALVVKTFVKMRGESGPYYLERVYDQGEPIGYRRVVGSKLLGYPEQEAAFRKLPLLPNQFSFKEAKVAYGKTDNPTRQWLKKCEAAGIVRQCGRGCYEVLETPPATVADGNAGEGQKC